MERLKQLDEEPDGRAGDDEHEQREDPSGPGVLSPLRGGAPAGLCRTTRPAVAPPTTASAIGGAVALAVEPRLFALFGGAFVAVRHRPRLPSHLVGWPASPRAGELRRASPRPPNRPCARPAAW